jgi:SagB-type dehydrogenase family enzyme
METRRHVLKMLCLVPLAGALANCRPNPAPIPARRNTGDGSSLPEPAQDGQTSLEQVLAQRRSIRQYIHDELTTAQLSQLLWAAQGITHERGFRTAPSAGALYPLEVYVATAGGLWHYDPGGHRLLKQGDSDIRQDLYGAALRQEAVRLAPAVFCITAVYERTSGKYGADRSQRYVHMEAGHAAQNLLLQAVALGLGAVPIGAFEDGQVQGVIGAPPDHQPLYLIPVGVPAPE